MPFTRQWWGRVREDKGGRVSIALTRSVRTHPSLPSLCPHSPLLPPFAPRCDAMQTFCTDLLSLLYYPLTLKNSAQSLNKRAHSGGTKSQTNQTEFQWFGSCCFGGLHNAPALHNVCEGCQSGIICTQRQSSASSRKCVTVRAVFAFVLCSSLSETTTDHYCILLQSFKNPIICLTWHASVESSTENH